MMRDLGKQSSSERTQEKPKRKTWELPPTKPHNFAKEKPYHLQMQRLPEQHASTSGSHAERQESRQGGKERINDIINRFENMSKIGQLETSQKNVDSNLKPENSTSGFFGELEDFQRALDSETRQKSINGSDHQEILQEQVQMTASSGVERWKNQEVPTEPSERWNEAWTTGMLDKLAKDVQSFAIGFIKNYPENIDFAYQMINLLHQMKKLAEDAAFVGWVNLSIPNEVNDTADKMERLAKMISRDKDHLKWLTPDTVQRITNEMKPLADEMKEFAKRMKNYRNRGDR